MALDSCSCLHRKARSERIQVGVRVDLRAINVQLSPPDQLLLLALLDNGVEETAKDVHAIALADARQAGMIWQGFVQIVSDVPSDAEPIRCMPHELPFGAYSLEEHHELQFEEDNGINRGTTTACIGLLHKPPDKRKIKRSFEMAIE